VHLHIGLNRLDAIVATAANVVSPDIAHLSRDKRRLLVARIATGDWDASDDRSRAIASVRGLASDQIDGGLGGGDEERQ
jgi:hypothetical protein